MCRLADLLVLSEHQEKAILKLWEFEEWLANSSTSTLAWRLAEAILAIWNKFPVLGWTVLLFLLGVNWIVIGIIERKFLFVIFYLIYCVSVVLFSMKLSKFFCEKINISLQDFVETMAYSCLFLLTTFLILSIVTSDELFVNSIPQILIMFMIASIVFLGGRLFGLAGENLAGLSLSMAYVFMGSILLSAILLEAWESESYIEFGENFARRILSDLDLLCVNFVFDLITILVSLWILRKISRRSRAYIGWAMLDFASSLGLAIILRGVLWGLIPSAEPGPITASYQWTIKVATQSLSPSDADWRITPLLFTTFIPVATYSCLFLALGLVVKPILRIVRHLVRSISQNAEIPFTQAGLTFFAIIVAIKAIWGWIEASF